MKYKRLVVFIENKSGTFYQVGLDQEEMDTIASFISQVQGGKIKIREEKFSSLFFSSLFYEPRKNRPQ